MFLLRYAVGDDAGTGAGEDVISFLIGQADADAAIHIAGKIDVADGAAVKRRACGPSNSSMISQARILGAPDKVPAGKAAAMASTAVLSSRIVLCTVEPICMMWEKRRTLR